MQYLRRSYHDEPAQQLEDLEEILSTPAPVLSCVGDVHSTGQFTKHIALTGRSNSTPELRLSAEQPAGGARFHSSSLPQGDRQQQQPAIQLRNNPVNTPCDAKPASKASSIQQQLLTWHSNAYRQAVAPVNAVWSKWCKEPAKEQQQEASAVPLRSRLQIPDLHLVEHLANNKGAAVAASVAGAAAGGALAGPFGIAAGAKTGALLVAVGAAAAGAAQQYYLPVKSVAAATPTAS